MRDSSKAAAASQSSAVAGRGRHAERGKADRDGGGHAQHAGARNRPPSDRGLAELAEAATAGLGTTLPRFVQRGHRDEEEQGRPGAHDGRRQARADRAEPARGARSARRPGRTRPRTWPASSAGADGAGTGRLDPWPARWNVTSATRHALAAHPPSSRAASRGTCNSLTAVSIAYPPIVIVALKHPASRVPPSSTKAAMVRSAIRPLLEVPHVTQRSQNNLAVAPQLVTSSIRLRSAQSFRSRSVLPRDR